MVMVKPAAQLVRLRDAGFQASAVENLREEITLILATAKQDDRYCSSSWPRWYGAWLWSSSSSVGAFA